MNTSAKAPKTDGLKNFASFLSRYDYIDGYLEEDPNSQNEIANGLAKQNFKRIGKKAFNELALYLGLSQFQVNFNPGGPAVSGDLSLSGMFTKDKGVYINMSKDGSAEVLFRSIANPKDSSGGVNEYFSSTKFSHPEQIKEKVYRLLHLNENDLKASEKTQEATQTEQVENRQNPILDLPVASSEELENNPPVIKSETLTLPSTTRELLSGGEWFKRHPEKVLGEAFETTDRFGKPVTRIKGSMDTIIKGINVPALVIPDEAPSVLQSELKEPLEDLINDPEKKKNIERVIYSAKKAQADQVLRKLNNPGEETQDGDGTYHFEDILKQYNAGISEDEIRAWIWHKRKTGGFNDEKVILNKKNGWSKYAVPLKEAASYLDGWIKSGIVCYHEGDYIPSVLYYAENIYERQSALLKDKEALIEKFGLDQFNRQWEGLEKVKLPKLTLTDPNLDNRLFIKPDSAFAKEIEVSALADGTTLSVYSRKEKRYSNGPVPLVDAFKEWLRSLPKNEFKKSSEWNIITYYLEGSTPARQNDKAEKLRLKQNAKTEGDLFFVRFLAEALTREDQLKIEQVWNAKFNGYVEIDYFKVPVAFTCSSTFKNKPLSIRPVQREGLGFIHAQGSGCIAYDVGLGKTMTGILALAQAMEMGQCKRPLIVVPNQTYKNWMTEIRGLVDKGEVTLTGLLPQYPINDLYNLGTDYLDPLRDEHGKISPVPEYSISVVTYEGFNRLSFGEETWSTIGQELFAILNQGIDKKREQVQLAEKISEMMGKGIKGGMADIEDLGFDYAIVDEAHAMKKAFTQVKGEVQGDDESREKGSYEIRSGEPSMTALRGFMISQYILRQNKMRNVLLLTATPFTNSPLEIYSILALIGFQQLEQSGIKNIKQFFDTFIKTSNELVINAKLKPERKEIVLGFHNLIALQQLIYKFITYKTGEDANIQRPNKIVLPLVNRKEGNRIVPLPLKEQISTNLTMTTEQKKYMADVEAYVQGTTDLKHFCVNSIGLEEEPEDHLTTIGQHLDEANLSEDELEGTRILRGLSFARQLALSPFLYACNPNHNPSYLEYIETSPKLKYVMECISSVKLYHENHDQEVSGQVIYMNAGVHFFPLIKEYLIKKVGFKEDEIGIIKSGMSSAKKEGIKERFLGGEVKIIIGSASIKEGINLQTRSSVLYNCWLDWNPTDLKQLEGRIWRFGNIFANIRIVNPLMEDSIDTFIFQKQQEKSSRINEIWYRANRANTLSLEEFNPGELKMGLITDPHALAELILMSEREKLRDDITGLENQKKVLTEIAEQRDIFNKHIGHIKEVVSTYKPTKEEGQSRSIETIFKIFKDYLDDEKTNYSYQDQMSFDQARKANTALKRGIEQILAPRGLDITFDLKQLTGQMDKEVDHIRKYMEEKTGNEAVKKQAEKIIQERIKKGYTPKSVAERVKEFASLNDEVLSELMVYSNSEDAIEKKTQQLLLGRELESSSDAVEELEALVMDMEEMDKLLDELDRLNRAA